jgi:hypothetical protein
LGPGNKISIFACDNALARNGMGWRPVVCLRSSGKGLVIAACVLLSPAAAMLVAFALLEFLIGVAAAGGAVALLAVLGVGIMLTRRLLAPPVEPQPM